MRLTVVPYFWMFAIGMIFRLWWSELAAIRFGLPTVAGLFVILMFGSGFSWLDWKYDPTWMDLAKTSVVCLISVWLGTTPAFKSAFLVRHDIGYGVYLWHMLFVATAASMGWSGSYWLLAGVLGGTVVMASISWIFVEKPALTLKRRPAKLLPSTP